MGLRVLGSEGFNVGPALVSWAATIAFFRKAYRVPPIDDGGPQLCEVSRPGHKGKTERSFE